ncbi:hypothetical protein NERG_01245 [Nematocida ausubeli]|uniref:Uncharacterized protein n=1 Tax=Nematocida ausubeli (strain ATCC PRA-371 / ERTm2) TaxID=1913371 RepID=H8ZC02_NEMA1|nr:hypothetical protein NERG_01245 [Nematocida ausubeli]KAI5133991.1 hypothetical protein NEAUS06_0858 [Nematocida ausubeli]KAI5134274.1 hypothetical protein NEAUS06_1023 [Nematocida ausubeli]
MGRNEFSKQLRAMTYSEVENTLSDKKMQVLRMRNNVKGEEYKNTSEWITTKKDIARCLGVLTEKKRQEIREECERDNKPLPKFFTKKLPRAQRVTIPKATLERYRQNKHQLRRKIVVFTP